jgi:hypothetical protein
MPTTACAGGRHAEVGRFVAISLLVAPVSGVIGGTFSLVPDASRCCVTTPLGDVAVQAAPYFLVGAVSLALAGGAALAALARRVR